MQLYKQSSLIFAPESADKLKALKSTTFLAIAAHPDDAEFMAADGIARAYKSPNLNFTAVIATDGAGSERDGSYKNYSDSQMVEIRRTEQKSAARIGDYGAVVFLDYSSNEVKEPAEKNFVADLVKIIDFAEPDEVYIHNPADRHLTHVAVAIKSVAALRKAKYKPKAVYACEVWRGLDWVDEEDKVVFNLDGTEQLSRELVREFVSQNASGRDYTSGVDARRVANAVFFTGKVNCSRAGFAIDMTPLLTSSISVAEYMQRRIEKFRTDVMQKIHKFENN